MRAVAQDRQNLARASDGTIAGSLGLTEKQQVFTRAYTANGGNATEAARTADYANPEQEGWRLMRLPHVCAAIRAEREKEILTKGAATAWATMQDLMTNARYTGAVKFQAARWTLEAAGSGLAAHRAALGLPDGDKPLSEMTLDELDAFMRAGRQALDTLKEQREKVIEGVAVPIARNNARNSDDEPAQLTDLTGGCAGQSLPTQDDDASASSE